MTLLSPIWLLLALPLGVLLWLWRMPSPLLSGLRLAAFALLVAALAGLALELPSRAGTVVVLADRSASMPAGSEAAAREAIDLSEAKRPLDCRLAVVGFAGGAAIEASPRGGRFSGFTAALSPDASQLSDGLQMALALIPRETPGRLLVVSDGRWTGKDPIAVAALAAGRGIAIDYRFLSRSAAGDIAISSLEAPQSVAPGESFLITAWVLSPVPQEVAVEIDRGGRRLVSARQRIPGGLGQMTFRDRAEGGGVLSYRIRVAGEAPDPLPENNQARLLVGVEGPRPVLVASGAAGSNLPALLAAGGLAVKTDRPENWSLEELSGYSAVLLENLPAQEVGNEGMENISAWITGTGGGLMMTGGKNSFGPGGYFRSPLDALLPVSMELRREHRKLALAIVIALDRSGSMAMEAGGGRTKMDLANISAVQVMDLLSPMDEFGVIAVDSSPHIVTRLAPLGENDQGARAAILRTESMGGGIFVYEALAAASKMLLGATAGTRHLLLFADAADAEEPGAYKGLLERCRAANISVSVVGMGTPKDVDAELLRDIARRGDGRCFFTDDPGQLPRLFAQDTFVVARSSFIDEPVPVRFASGLLTLAGRSFGEAPALGGYNLCYLRPRADLAALTTDEYNAPVVASWQAGLGRVLAYTGEADGEFTGALAAWPSAGEFLTSLARWTAGVRETLPGNMQVTQRVANGVSTIELHLDPDREAADLARLPRLTTLSGVPGRKPEVRRGTLRWTSPDTLSAEVPLAGADTALSTLEIESAGRVTLPPVCLPYSPEFVPVQRDQGLATLERLAKATGGEERLALADIWKALPRRPRFVELRPWLLFAAILVLLLEVFERRTGLLTRHPRRILVRGDESSTPAAVGITGSRRKPKVPVEVVAKELPASVVEVGAAPGESPESPAKPDMLDALQKARDRAKNRR